MIDNTTAPVTDSSIDSSEDMEPRGRKESADMDNDTRLLIKEYEDLQAEFENSKPPESCQLGWTMRRFGTLMCRHQIIELTHPQASVKAPKITSWTGCAYSIASRSPWAAVAGFAVFVGARYLQVL